MADTAEADNPEATRFHRYFSDLIDTQRPADWVVPWSPPTQAAVARWRRLMTRLGADGVLTELISDANGSVPSARAWRIAAVAASHDVFLPVEALALAAHVLSRLPSAPQSVARPTLDDLVAGRCLPRLAVPSADFEAEETATGWIITGTAHLESVRLPADLIVLPWATADGLVGLLVAGSDPSPSGRLTLAGQRVLGAAPLDTFAASSACSTAWSGATPVHAAALERATHLAREWARAQRTDRGSPLLEEDWAWQLLGAAEATCLSVTAAAAGRWGHLDPREEAGPVDAVAIRRTAQSLLGLLGREAGTSSRTRVGDLAGRLRWLAALEGERGRAPVAQFGAAIPAARGERPHSEDQRSGIHDLLTHPLPPPFGADCRMAAWCLDGIGVGRGTHPALSDLARRTPTVDPQTTEWAPQTVSALVLATHGNTLLHHEWLYPAAPTRRRITAAVVEDDGPQGERPSTWATARKGGFRITGTKWAVPLLPSADAVLVPAFTSDGTALFLVQPGDVGVTVVPTQLVDGTEVGRLELDATPVPEDRLVGTTSGAATTQLLDLLTLAYCAQLLGVCWASHDQQPRPGADGDGSSPEDDRAWELVRAQSLLLRTASFMQGRRPYRRELQATAHVVTSAATRLADRGTTGRLGAAELLTRVWSLSAHLGPSVRYAGLLGRP